MSSNSKQQYASSAPPPWHSVAVLGLFLAVFSATLPTLEDFDRHATKETFTQSLFFKDVSALAYARLLIAAGIFATTLTSLLSQGWIQHTPYVKGSKLKSVSFRVKGFRALWPFTSLSWNLLGSAYLISGLVCFFSASEDPRMMELAENKSLLRSGLALWQVAAPNAFLVSIVVRYAIWPEVLKSGKPTASLKYPRVLLQHNANIFLVLCESALLGGLPVLWTNISLAPIVGALYVLFSWAVCCSWTVPEHGPQFIYHFFDTTVPGPTPTVALLVLLFVLLLFFAFFCGIAGLLQYLEGWGFGAHAAFVVIVSSCVCRFRD